jgi:uncharacterized protein (TIGR04255 family)
VSTQYENAPIVEAVIFFVIEPDPALLTNFDSLRPMLEAEYPNIAPIELIEAKVNPSAGSIAKTERKPLGCRYASLDAKWVAQARIDGFALSRLKPYTKWADLRERAERLWKLFRGVIGDRKIKQISCQNVNKIDIPAKEGTEYKDYFRTIPEISPALPQGLANFYMQLQIPSPPVTGVFLTLSSDNSVPGTASINLDINAVRQMSGSESEEELWLAVDQLRDIKNDFFEGCVTDRTRALFGKREDY